MPVEGLDGDRQALRYLFERIERPMLVRIAILMLVASLTEGFGLVLLVPLTQIVADQPPAALAPWVASLAGWPLPMLLGAFFAVVLFRAALMMAVLNLREALSSGLVRLLRTEMQQAIVGADWRWLTRQRGADHAALIVGETERVGAEANRALDMATCATTLVALLVAAFWLAWDLTLATLALGVLAAAGWIALRRRGHAFGEPFSREYRRLQSHVSDGLAHLRAARIAGAQRAVLDDFAATAAALDRIERQYHAATSRAHFGLQVISAAMLVVLVMVGLQVLLLPLALFVPVLAIFVRIVPLVGAIQQGWRAWRFCRPAIDRLQATLAAAKAAAEPESPPAPPVPLSHAIVLDAVHFAHPGRERAVFEALSLTLPAGSITGISGPSGSGKSTLADLLSGLVAPDAGTIRVDDTVLSGEARIRWRRQVAYVEQTPYLVDGTVGENLAWGSGEVDRDRLEQALRDASAEFVLALPRGIDTPVGEIGRSLSGGERQRISLARALVRAPSLLILDEATAALDAANEAAIGATIARLRGRCTVVVLGHRAALLDIADRVIHLGGDEPR